MADAATPSLELFTATSLSRHPRSAGAPQTRTVKLVPTVVSLVIAAGVGCNEAELVTVDGSSTVFPITEAVAEEFRASGRARVTIGVSGTGGGFKKFCKGEVAIAGASRPIMPAEIAQCEQAGVDFIELPVAYDGIVVVVNPSNDWVDALSVDELRKIWAPESQGAVRRWSDVRPGWPDAELHLFGPGVDSGTYDYFTLAVVGREHASRGDFTSSEDDNVLVQGVASDPYALGFFGYAYYAENANRLKLVPVRNSGQGPGASPVVPSPQSISDGSYHPLTRPVFLYVSTAAVQRPAVAQFVSFYLEQGPALAHEVGYVPLPPSARELVRDRFDRRATGSAFRGRAERIGVTVEQILAAG